MTAAIRSYDAMSAAMALIAAQSQQLATMAQQLASLDARVRDIEAARKEPPPPPPPEPPSTEEQHREQERERYLRALSDTDWSRAEAARLLGVPRRTFYRRMEEFGLRNRK